VDTPILLSGKGGKKKVNPLRPVQQRDVLNGRGGIDLNQDTEKKGDTQNKRNNGFTKPSGSAVINVMGASEARTAKGRPSRKNW